VSLEDLLSVFEVLLLATPAASSRPPPRPRDSTEMAIPQYKDFNKSTLGKSFVLLGGAVLHAIAVMSRLTFSSVDLLNDDYDFKYFLKVKSKAPNGVVSL
jgi:hypothetical protein